MINHQNKKILITYGRSFLALELARQLHAAGHTVYVADSIRFHVARFSNAISKSYKVPSPRYHPEAYLEKLIAIVKQEKIDFLLPIYEETSLLSQAHDRIPEFCQLFCPPFELFDDLHHKWRFQCKLKELGIETLRAALVQSPHEISQLDFTTPFALKPCYSRASQKVKKVYPQQAVDNLSIEPYNPWIAQEWMEGDKFCTYTICHEGKIYAHSTYPVNYAIDGNSCLIFESITHPGIYAWIEHFVKSINYTGQIAFDFIESAQKKLYAIECNPRATSGLLLFNFSPETRLDRALFKKNASPLLPEPHARQQIATGMLLYGWKKSAIPNNNIFRFLKNFCSTKDVILRSTDLKPFLFQPLIFASIWKNSRKQKLSIPDYFTHDHDWNGEVLPKLNSP